MVIIEYQAPSRRTRAEHSRIIRQMGRDVLPPNPIAMALCEIGAVLLGGGIWIGLCWGIASWLLA